MATKSLTSRDSVGPAGIAGKAIAYGLAAALMLGAIAIARVDMPRPVAGATEPAPAAGISASVSSSPLGIELLLTGVGDVTRRAEVHTTIPDRPRYDISKYTIEKGDTVFKIAQRFGLQPETIIWGNVWLADNPNALYEGQVLNILPVDGALRVVQPGDTLEKIAKVFHGTLDEIVAYPGNDLDPEDPEIREGQNLIIPGGWRELVTWQLPVVTRKGSSGSGQPGECKGPYTGPSGSYTFVWPGGLHEVSGNEYIPKVHPGIDIAAWAGMPVYASDTGVVVYAGWSTVGYGNLVIVDHGNGWQTAYAHLSQINKGCGASVYQGQVLGLAGSTGNSTGPHIHFEMRSDIYGRVNPWLYLPPP